MRHARLLDFESTGSSLVGRGKIAVCLNAIYNLVEGLVAPRRIDSIQFRSSLLGHTKRSLLLLITTRALRTKLGVLGRVNATFPPNCHIREPSSNVTLQSSARVMPEGSADISPFAVSLPAYGIEYRIGYCKLLPPFPPILSHYNLR